MYIADMTSTSSNYLAMFKI